MQRELSGGPIINFDAEPTEEEKAAVIEQLRAAIQRPAALPLEALNLLFETACGDTGGSQAARTFLFWLIGSDDPIGFKGDGGLELRRLDGKRKKAAIEVLAWWAGPTQSDDPLHRVLARLQSRFAGRKQPDSL